MTVQHISDYQRGVRDTNREAIRAWLADRPGARVIEVAYALGIARQTASRHVTALRAEWRARDKAARS